MHVPTRPGTGKEAVVGLYASSADEVDALCGSRLLRFDQVAVFRRDDLERAGVEIVPTFRTRT